MTVDSSLRRDAPRMSRPADATGIVEQRQAERDAEWVRRAKQPTVIVSRPPRAPKPPVIHTPMPRPPFWTTPDGLARLRNSGMPVGTLENLPSVSDVINAVCQVAGITIFDILGPRRHRKLSYPRHVAMLLMCQRRWDFSMPQIGEVFRKDHTSVVNGRDRAIERIQVEGSDSARWYREASEILDGAAP